MPETTMATVYDPAIVERKIYQFWLRGDYFRAGKRPGEKAFTIVIPPPNVTGSLHMGHALNNTIQDVLIRWRRMQGYDTLWLPGCDHAGIATQNVVEKHLAEEGVTARNLGREAFLERVWEWKETYHARITEQLYRLGVSCDWSRERFTLDEGCSRAVRKVFVDLYRRGLIYRGDYMINWCPRCGTALSDIEVEHVTRDSTLTYIRYPLADGDGFITVATTRPESMLGDTGVAVHPQDHRYNKLVGRTVLLPLMNRKIPIVADEYVDPSFGSGAVKVTPAHDPNDLAIALRHNLDIIPVIDEAAQMTEAAGAYVGMDRSACRDKVVEDLRTLGLTEKMEEYSHAPGQCQRCDTLVEPMISRQWFVKMKPLAEPALAAVSEGKTVFMPDRFTGIYFNWLENIRDWCISRQIWWGHRIPAWHCACGELIVDYDEPDLCPSCGGRELRQDPDVLDTWFSSALWPFSTLGWPDKTPDLGRYFPTSVLVTGYDIIYFWVARMLFMSLAFMEEVPFHTVYINGLVRDFLGRKMSKSIGNGIDPLEVVECYGADTLRYTLVIGQAPGSDQRFRQENVEAGRNFANKIWNASRFVIMNLGGESGEPEYPAFDPLGAAGELSRADRWVLHRYNETVRESTRLLEEYELGEAAREVYEFFWSDFCDWYVEFSKHYLYQQVLAGADGDTKRRTRGVLLYVLDGVLRLIHPFMPFISEEIWQYLPRREEALAVAPWPRYQPELCFSEAAREMHLVQDTIRAVRNLRSQVGLAPGLKAPLLLRASGGAASALLEERHQLLRLAFAGPVEIGADAAKPRQALAAMIGDEIEAYLPLAGVIDLNAEVSRLEKELSQVISELKQTQGKLENSGFLEKAPAEVVTKQKLRRDENLAKQEKLEARLRELR